MPIFPLPSQSLDTSCPTGEVQAQSILVVDDDLALRSTTAMMLESEGFHVRSASNGLEALQELERSARIDAILLDLLMPVMDGRETFRQLRHFWGSIPVIIISGFDLGDLGQDLITAPDGYLRKPFSFAHLTGALGAVLH